MNKKSTQLCAISLAQTTHLHWLCYYDRILCPLISLCYICNKGFKISQCYHFNQTYIHLCEICQFKIEQINIKTKVDIVRSVLYIKFILNDQKLQDLYHEILLQYIYCIRHYCYKLLK